MSIIYSHLWQYHTHKKLTLDIMQSTIPDLTTKTGALVTLPHAVKGKRGFTRISKAQQRTALLAFRLKEADVRFVDAFCEKYGMTKTELLQRALACYTGYDGKNAKQLLR